MTKGEKGDARERAKWTWIAGLLASVAGFANFLQFGGYTPLSVLMLVSALLFAILWLPAAWFAGRGRIHLVLVAIVIGYIGFRQDSPVISGIIGLLFALVVFWKQVAVLRFAAIIFGVIAISSPLQGGRPIMTGKSDIEATSDLTPLIHIILDEHGTADYRDIGFSSWMHAHSPDWNTVKSVPIILDGYVPLLKRKGYAVETWQTAYLDICEDNCLTYWENSLEPLGELGFIDRMNLGLGAYARFLTRQPQHLNTNAMVTYQVFEDFIERANRIEPGEALIFHALLPHYPLAYNAECQLQPVHDWTYRNHDGARADYEEQVGCVKTLLSQLPEDAHVVVHGDHGDRLVKGGHPEIDADHVASLHTLFAIRDGKGELYEEETQVRDLLMEYAESLLAAN